MRVFIVILIFIFGLNSLTKADGIQELEIERMSIGDSLLDHYNNQQISEFIKLNYPDKKFIFANIILKEKEFYNLQIGYKNGDENYIIELLNGVIRFGQEIESCYKKQDQIREFIVSNIIFLKEEDPIIRQFLPTDAPNKVRTRQFKFNLTDGNILLYCIDHPVENYKEDKLKLQMQTNAMSDYLQSQY
tara:strand:- start:1674 stop:2240 length:567 start_codon:yes stop_codon:yes gene_type:complete